ncbi:hypothetical protein Droror1_Dr00025215 [Drosera rotundifolia]
MTTSALDESDDDGGNKNEDGGAAWIRVSGTIDASTSADAGDSIQTPTDVVDPLANMLEVDEAYDAARVDAADLARTVQRFRSSRLSGIA